MVPEPISAESRQLLGQLRDLLLDQHKLLLDREKATYEAEHGRIASPGQFLNLVIGDPHFSWLKTLSTLVVEIDEALARRSKAGQAEASALEMLAKDTVRPRELGTDFQMRYHAAIQQSPDVVILQCRIESLLSGIRSTRTQ